MLNMNNNTQTLLVYEQVPEDTHMYLIPNRIFDEHPDWRDLMRQAHNKYVNRSGDKYNDGMSFLSAALVPIENVDNDSYFYDGDVVNNVQTGKNNRMKNEWRCVFDKYKVNLDTSLTDVNIIEVVLSGFIM